MKAFKLTRIVKHLRRAFLVTVVTVLILELLLQFAFPLLPATLARRMPQYRLRLGFDLQTEHGALEYPAGERVAFDVTREAGDLYRLTCLSSASAPPFADYNVSFTRDGHGFRNLEPWPAQVDVAVLGDSFTAAEAIVEPFWRGISNSMLVLGLPGSGTLEQQRLYEAYAKPRRPRALILAYFAGNDIMDNLTYYENTRAGLTWADLSWRGRQPWEFSVVFHLLLLARDQLLAPAAECHYPQIANSSSPTPVAFFDRFLPLLALDEATLAASEMWRVTRASIEELAHSQEADNARLVLMYIPQKAELYWDYLERESKQAILDGIAPPNEGIGIEEIDANLSTQRNLLSGLAAELGIALLDLRAPLNAAISAGQAPYFFADTHWNQLGHDIVRSALLDFMNRTNL